MKSIVTKIIISAILCVCVFMAKFLFFSDKGDANNAAVADIKITYGNNESEKGITQNLKLPSVDKNGNKIIWTSSNELYINSNGVVNPPTGDNVIIDLMATIKSGKNMQTKKFNIVVLKHRNAKKIKDNSINDLVEYNNGNEPGISEDDDGNVDFIEGKYTDFNIKSANDAIYSLNSIKTIMKMNSPENEFVLIRIDKVDNLIYYRLQQVFNRITVYGKDLIVIIDDTGNGVSVTGHYKPITNFNTNPKIQEKVAMNMVKQYTKNKSIESVELVIYTTSATICLAWQMDIGDELIFLDANTGDVIGNLSLIND